MSEGTEKIRVGASSCLLGEKVRWNGDHKQDRYIKDVLGQFFEWVPVCPEFEVGMGVPRETVQLTGTPDKPSMVGRKSGTDWTAKMNRFTGSRVKEMADMNLSGFIFKSKSPSCGLGRVPIYEDRGSDRVRHGRGLFADGFIKRFPLVPTEDEGRLHDARIRENFIVRVFSFHRIRRLFEKGANAGTLVKFHTDHKFLLLAHSRKHYQALGRLVADVKKMKWSEARETYGQTLMEALTFKSTTKKNTDVLMHMMGFFKKLLSGEEKQDILETIEDYRNGLIPLVVPLTLIRHHVRKHRVEYLQNQVYLNPHPKELMLRNHV